MSRRSKKQTVYSTCWESATFSPRRISLFSPLKSSVVIESNTNRIMCSLENTKIKARRACKLFFTKKKQAKEKRSWSVRRSPIHSLCVSHGYEPTPRLFRTRIALLCENDVALASPIVILAPLWNDPNKNRAFQNLLFFNFYRRSMRSPCFCMYLSVLIHPGSLKLNKRNFFHAKRGLRLIFFNLLG